MSEPSLNDVLKKLDQIHVSMIREALTISDIAMMMDVSTDTVRRIAKTDLSFPQSREYPTSNNTSVRRYIRSEVLEWIRRKNTN